MAARRGKQISDFLLVHATCFAEQRRGGSDYLTCPAFTDSPSPAAQDLKPPTSFLCPITHELMKNPVLVIESGHSYEEDAIVRWFSCRRTDPLTNVNLTCLAFVANHTLRNAIHEFVAELQGEEDEVADAEER